MQVVPNVEPDEGRTEVCAMQLTGLETRATLFPRPPNSRSSTLRRLRPEGSDAEIHTPARFRTLSSTFMKLMYESYGES